MRGAEVPSCGLLWCAELVACTCASPAVSHSCGGWQRAPRTCSSAHQDQDPPTQLSSAGQARGQLVILVCGVAPSVERVLFMFWPSGWWPRATWGSYRPPKPTEGGGRDLTTTLKATRARTWKRTRRPRRHQARTR